MTIQLVQKQLETLLINEVTTFVKDAMVEFEISSFPTHINFTYDVDSTAHTLGMKLATIDLVEKDTGALYNFNSKQYDPNFDGYGSNLKKLPYAVIELCRNIEDIIDINILRGLFIDNMALATETHKTTG
ncbi:hypothetical protein D3C78_20610 [compost metagenome]